MTQTQSLASRCPHWNRVLKGEQESVEGGELGRASRLRDKQGHRDRKEMPGSLRNFTRQEESDRGEG